MKLYKYLFLGIAVMLLSACDDEENENVGRGENIEEFKLVSPANFSELNLNPGIPDQEIVVEWEAAKTGLESAPSYTFLLDEKGGDFSSPVLSVNADNNGKDPKITLTVQQLITAVTGKPGDVYQWTIEATTTHKNGINTRRATNVFDLSIHIASAGITDFTYTYPALNEKIRLDVINLDTEMAFTWEPAEATGAGTITYTWYASSSETDFSNPVLELPSDNDGTLPSLTITNGTLVEVLQQLDAPGFYWKVVASAGDNNYSPSTRFVWFEQFSPLIDYIYLVGDASPGGWDNNAGVAMFRDPANGLLFTYVGKLNSGSLKFLKERGQWAPQWGDGGGGELAYRATEADPDPPAISISATGYYTVVFNGADNTFSISSYDVTGKPDYTTIGIIGTATPNGWGDPDTDMTQSAFDSHHWFIDGQDLIANPMKFRANDAWTVNWGSDKPSYGVGVQGGPDIPVNEAGNYLIRFCDLTGQYAVIKKPN